MSEKSSAVTEEEEAGMSNPEPSLVPSPNWKDHAHLAVKIGIGAIPVVGSGAAELFNAILAPPIEGRRNTFLADLLGRVEDLRAKALIGDDKLTNNEAFVSAVLQTTQAATRTHNEEKRRHLRNAAINSVLPGAPDDDIQQMFIALVDQFTEWHVRLLALLADPLPTLVALGKTPPQFMIAGSLWQMIVTAYPELGSREPIAELILSDLKARGLYGGPALKLNLTGQGIYTNHATNLGASFLRFIADPTSVSG